MLKLIPTWPIAVGTLVIGLGVGAAGMSWWDADEIADRDIKIANLQRDKAVTVATQANAALADLTAASANIKAAAEASQVNYAGLNTKLEAIDRRYRNAKPPAPLPADCRPGTERLQRLTEGTAAVNQAIAGPTPGK